jgi:hypothetical protein
MLAPFAQEAMMPVESFGGVRVPRSDRPHTPPKLTAEDER